MSDNKAHDLSNIRYEGGKDHLASKVAIVVSKWNTDITETLYKGAYDVLLAAGVNPNFIHRIDVPGSYELPMGAAITLEKNHELDGVICLGCVIQGETRHFEFISDAVAHGVMRVGLDYKKPVIFGVLTPGYRSASSRQGRRKVWQ